MDWEVLPDFFWGGKGLEMVRFGQKRVFSVVQGHGFDLPKQLFSADRLLSVACNNGTSSATTYRLATLFAFGTKQDFFVPI